MIKQAVVLATVATLFTGCWNVGQGEKIGQVVKVNEQSGFFCKTVEVEIVRGGFNNGSGVNGSSLHFTIENNPKAVDVVKQAMLDGSEIQVKYHQELASFCRSDSHSTFADDVTLVKEELRKDTNTTKSTSKNEEILQALILQNKALQKLLKD